MKIPYSDDYIKYLKENSYNNSTIHSYNYALKDFNKYIEENEINFKLLKLSDINNYIEDLRVRKSKSTININLSCLKNYFAFLKKYKGVVFNFDINEIKKIKGDRKIKNKIDCVDVLKKLKFIESKRDYLIIQLILKTGIRISELVKIKREDIFKNKIKFIGNEYILDEELNRKINDFVLNNPNKKSEYLFTPQKSITSAKNNNLTTRSVERMLKKYFKNYSYSDLKLVYYKSLCEKLPDIIKINKHDSFSKMELRDTNKII